MTAKLSGMTWSTPQQLAQDDAFFANWADLPGAIEADDGTRYAHWLQKLGEDTYAYGVQLTRSTDRGETWEPVGLLHDDDSPTEHGFVSYATLHDGIQAFWLDGRAMIDGGAMQLRTTRLGRDAPPAPSTILDDRVCECCQTDATASSTGPVVVYRDRSESEIRDVAVVRFTDDGWTEPAILHEDGWEIPGCPVNGPAIAAAADLVAVAWFTVAGGKSRVQVAFSHDAGASFGPPIEVDAREPRGNVDVVLDLEGHAQVLWMGTTEEGGEVLVRRVAASGEVGYPRRIAATTTKRSAGVPRMVRRGDELVVTWVEDVEPSRVRVALVPIG